MIYYLDSRTYTYYNNEYYLNFRDRPRISAEGTMQYDSMLTPPLPEWDGDPRPQEGTSFIDEGLMPQRKGAAVVFNVNNDEEMK